MASHRITLDTDTISMTAAAADSLITRGQGDPALLYLYLLRHQGYLDPNQSAKELGWSRLQLDSALTHLRELAVSLSLSSTRPSPNGSRHPPTPPTT